MLTLHQRLGVIDLAGSVALAVLHLGVAVSYLIPGLATGVYAPTPGRVSVVSYIDQAGPVWQIGFGLSATILILAVAKPRFLVLAHALSGGVLAIFCAALWFGWGASDPHPSVLTALMATGGVLWHLVLCVTYSAVVSLPVRAGGSHRGEASR